MIRFLKQTPFDAIPGNWRKCNKQYYRKQALFGLDDFLFSPITSRQSPIVPPNARNKKNVSCAVKKTIHFNEKERLLDLPTLHFEDLKIIIIVYHQVLLGRNRHQVTCFQVCAKSGFARR
jgi:hypothetical protein